MTSLVWLPVAEQAGRLRFEWGRIQSNSDWILPIVAFLAIATFVRWMYRRDALELGLLWRWLLTGLRTAAVFGLLILYLQPRWRSEHEVVHPSRVVLLVDTSLSMGLADADSSSGSPGISRSRQVAASLVAADFLRRLRATHEVAVLRFDETVGRVASLRNSAREAEDSDDGDGGGDASSPGEDSVTGGDLSEASIDWEKALKPSGKETRLGQSLQQVIADQRGAPVSGIVLVSDGCQNAGPPAETAVESAREARIPIFTVGVGSARRPTSVRVYELEAPERAHPGDPYTVTGLIQSQGMAGQPAAVQLFVRDPDKGSEQLVDSQQIILGTDGASAPVKFQVTATEVGRRQVVLRVVPPAAARNPADNQREVDVEIVDRKNHVLLFAGGPSREYQFLKSLLYRDKSTTVDVLLQTAKPGVSQEGAKILDRFPDSRQAMFSYDCIVALDPQWQALNPAQIDLLESWVGEQGGGLLVAAGPIYTGQTVSGWLQSPATAKIRSLYPVEFQRRATAMESETYASKDPWPLDFTREGREAEFLWLADSESANQQAWASFPGVYSCQPIRGPKPGATVFARFSDPQAGQGDRQPPYFAGQFYGSGRVFYMGSGELWRLRRVEEGYFDQLYTRLIRHVSQGRLLRQSQRGSLLVDKERYLLGNTVEIRAQLTDAQLKPLRAPSVALDVIQPNRGTQSVILRSDPSREGMYAGQFTVLNEGVYRLELPVLESDRERIVRRIQVRLPDLERENPQRNDALLSRIATGSGGKYYPTIDAAWGPETPDPLAGHLKDRTRTSIVTSGPNPLSERPWLQTMMLVLCGLLCGEWLVRRLLKLA
jgi:hypothetical protein